MADDETDVTRTEPVAAAPRRGLVVTRDGRANWPLLAILAVLTGLLVAVFVNADISRIADESWRENALWAATVAAVLLGVALAAVAWSMTSASSDSLFPRASTVAAIVAVMGAVVVIGVANEQGGHLATSDTAIQVIDGGSSSGGEDGEDADGDEEVIRPRDALVPQNLANAAIPIEIRTVVTVDLTSAGRALLARAMDCRASDFRTTLVVANAIGGTWAQPLLIVGAPTDEEGEPVVRCKRTIVQLPIQAGTIRPYTG